MNKYFTYAFTALLGAMTAVTFSACSDSDDNGSIEQEQNNALEKLTTPYINSIVYDTYGKLAAHTETLYNQISALKVKLTAEPAVQVQQSEIDAICQTYKDARKEWEESEAFLFGAASDFEIDPHIDTWPLDVAVLANDLSNDAIIAQLNGEGGIDYAREYLTAENLGFHGLEFIFFRDGANRSVSIFNNDVVENYSYQGQAYFNNMTVTGKEEVIFATAVAGDLRDKCYQLEVAWMGDKAPAAHVNRIKALYANDSEEWKYIAPGTSLSYGQNMLAATTGPSTYTTWKKVVEEIFDGCSDICAEVADQKMGQAYRAATHTEPTFHEGEEGEQEQDDPNYIESPYSHNSFTDFYGNIISIKNSLYGGRNLDTPSPTSILSYLKKYNAEEAATLDAKLQAALASLVACQNSGVSFVQAPGAAYVGAAIDAISNLDEELNTAKNWILKN